MVEVSDAVSPVTRRGMLRDARARVVAGAAGGVALAACGPLRDSRPAGGGDRPPATLELWGLSLQRHEEAYKKIVDDWQAKDPKERVVLVPQPEGLDTKLTAAVAGGTPPEMASRHPSGLPLQTARKWLEPVNPLYREAKIDPNTYFLPVAWEPWEIKGKIYGVPFEDNAAGWGIGLRTDLFQEAGLRVPDPGFRSWDEVYETARKLSKREGAEVVRWGYSANAMHLLAWIAGAMEEAGQPYVDKAKGKYQFNTPIGHDVLKK